MKTSRIRIEFLLVIIVLMSSVVFLAGCKKAEQAPTVVVKEALVAAVGFRTGFYKSEKESDESERVYYVLSEATVTRMVFTDDGLESTEVEGTYRLEGETLIFLSSSGSKRTYTVTPDGNIKSGLGALWIYAGPIDSEENPDGSGEVIFKDSMQVKTVVSMKGVYVEGWYDESQSLYLMRFKDAEGEKILQADELPKGKLFNAAKSKGNDALYGLTFHIYYLEEEGADPITGEEGKVRTLVTAER